LGCKDKTGIDLHVHSTASDGTLSPSELLALARDLGLGALAITDHDTLEGSREALQAGIPNGLEFLTGVEISAQPPASFTCPGSFHILGYQIRLDDPVLNETLLVLQNARKNRNPQILERLNKLGIPISLDEIRREAGKIQLGRPHIAQFMVQKGWVETIDEAFDVYLGKGRPAYVDKFRITCARAIEIIGGAGGVPVLAHPYLLEAKSEDALDNLVFELKSMGLRGVEVFYPSHTPDQTARYESIARRHGLLMTGGTDFHGLITPDIKMGSGNGNLFIPYSIYENLISHC
jgi:predicted metal-dependent phosphoesterase TrpH